MSLKLESAGALLAQIATTVAIDVSAKDPAGRYASAQVAMEVAAAFKSVSTGDLASAETEVQQAVLSKITDPGQAALVTAIFTQGNNYLAAAAQAAGSLPLVNATVTGAAGEIADGITAAASAYPAPASK